MEILSAVLEFVGVLGIVTIIVAKVNKVSLDESWNKLREKICQAGNWVSNVIKESLEEPRQENVVVSENFLPKMQKLVERFSLIPLEVQTYWWGICHNKWWSLKLRLFCKKEDAKIIESSVVQLIQETLVDFGHSNIVIRQRITECMNVPNQFDITIDYACSEKEQNNLKVVIQREDDRKIAQMTQPVVDESLEKELEHV